MEKIIYNACILPMDATMRVIENGFLYIRDGVIEEIGEGNPGEAAHVVKEDLNGRWMMPGFVNTHTHIPMVLLRGYADDLPLREWLTEHIFPAEAKWIYPETIRTTSRIAMTEMIRSGTTCFNDMYFFSEVIAQEAAQAGIRTVLNDSLIDMPAVSFTTVKEGLTKAETLIRHYAGDNLIHPSVCVHSPYACSKDTLVKAKKLADKYGAVLHIHLSETAEEVVGITEQTGMRPAEYLYRSGILDRHTVAAHSVWLDAAEIELFAKTGASIAHCPKSNLKLASGMANTHTYMCAGINVGIGTDGASSNNTLDMAEEMRFASLLAKGITGDPTVVGAKESLRMATINGARSLGLGEVTGSLEKGKKADLIVIEPRINMQPVYDPYSALVYAMNSGNIHSSMVNGKWIMHNRKLLTINEDELQWPDGWKIRKS